MEKQFITAQEAKGKAENYSNMENICQDIQAAAEEGKFRRRFFFISAIDIPKLVALGYTVKEDHVEKFPYTVSWE